MPIRIYCSSCAAGLKIADQHAGKTVACPKCKHPVKVPAAEEVVELDDAEEMVEAAPKRPAAAVRSAPIVQSKKIVAIQAEKPAAKPVKAVVARTAEVDADEVEEVVEAPLKKKRQVVAANAEDEDDVPEAVEDTPVKRKKKKKKRRRKPEEEALAPIWPWYAAAGFFLLIIVTAGIWLLFHSGAMGTIGVLALTVVIMFPISAIFFIISLFICSLIEGGVELGPIQTAIPKAALLICIVNLFLLLPGGIYLSAIPWVLGMMGLFGMSLWEAKIIFASNWVMNWIFNWVVMTAIVGAIMRQQDKDRGFEPPRGGGPQQVAPVPADGDD